MRPSVETTMAARTCTSCFRELAADDTFCRRCFRRETPLARIVLLLGVAGAPLLAAGLLGFNLRLCVLGGAISAAAVLLHIVLALR